MRLVDMFISVGMMMAVMAIYGIRKYLSGNPEVADAAKKVAIYKATSILGRFFK